MSRFFKSEEAVDIALLGNEDYKKRDRMRLLKWSKYVWQDLNLTAVKKARRARFGINKRTNTVDMPCDFLQLSSVSVIDKFGIEYPVYRNSRVTDDIVDVAATKNCGCEYNCNSKLCNTIKGYESVVSTKEDKNPDGSTASFECIDRKAVDDQGFFYEQTQYPKRIYVDGVWTETILFTEDRKLCKVEVDEHGCVCDTEENLNALCDSCGFTSLNTSICCVGGTSQAPPNDTCNTWVYYCNNKLDWFSVQCGCFPCSKSEFSNIYNISELGDRLIFPANFGWDNVMIRWYEDSSDADIPIIAIDTFVAGLKWWDCRFNDKKLKLAKVYESDYSALKFGLVKELNKYRIAELGKIVSPPIYIPSYITGRTNKYEGNARNTF
jgi:hypothetical protein